MKATSVLLAFVLSLSALQGCAPMAMRKSSPPPAEVAADSPGGIRVMGADHRFADVSINSVARRAQDLRGGEPITILALSGGGADGAFGAGALVGLTHAGARPKFSVVTGVSAGAFLAAYAFVGPEWDEQLIDSYTSGRAEHLLQPRGLGMIFDSSVYRGRPLEQLVDHYLSDALIQAVAHEAASGRLLLVATTNVDTGETVVWDLGSIAMNGGPDARALFRDVLVASASVPGLFPPVIIRVQGDRGDYSEAHVDGTTTVPFLVPSAFLHEPGQLTDHSPPEVYVIVDGRLSEQPASVQLRFKTIVSRSISAGLIHMTRTALELTATTAQLQGASLQYSAIPTAYPKLESFDFRTSTMRSLYQYGYECAHTGRLWVASEGAVTDHPHRGESDSGQIGCPADDGYIARFAVR
jgi:predicted acylesterase/phospholipase RssA